MSTNDKNDEENGESHSSIMEGQEYCRVDG